MIDTENEKRATFDSAKKYRYTWPGQSSRVIGGEALTDLCKGADPSMLAIEEVPEADTSPRSKSYTPT
jgi:hypothetical protein